MNDESKLDEYREALSRAVTHSCDLALANGRLRKAVMLLARALPNRSDLNDEQKRAWYALRDALLRRWPDKE